MKIKVDCFNTFIKSKPSKQIMDAFLYRVAQDLKNNFGADISKIAVVFNNKRPTIFLKKYLSEVYGQTMMLPEMFTIQEFFALSSRHAVANDLRRFFILLKCYNQILEAEHIGPETPESFYALSQTILSDFDQIDYELADVKSVFSYLKDFGEIKQKFSDFTEEQQEFIENFWETFSADKQAAILEKFIELWTRMPALYQAYQEQMEKENLQSMSVIYRKLASGEADVPDFSKGYKKIVFVGFNALNKCEATIFKQWQKEEKALFYFDADRYYMDDDFQEAGLFLRKNIVEFGLKNQSGVLESHINSPDKILNVYPVSGYTMQAKALGVWLNKQIVERPDKTAIILADENLLTPLLQSIPDDFIINVTMGYPIRQNSFYQLILAWLEIQQSIQNSETVSRKEIENLLSLVLLDFKETDKNKILEEYEQHNSKTFLNFIKTSYPICKLFFDKQEDGLKSIDALIALIREVLQKQEQQNTLRQITGSLMVRTFQELNRLKDYLYEFQDMMGIQLALKFIQKAVSGIITPLEGQPLQGIQVMGMLESRCLDFDEVYILGANEGTLPFTGMGNSFIPETLRKAFGLPLRGDKEALVAYLFYRLFQRAKKVHIFYNKLVDESSNGEVSRYVRQLEFESNINVNEVVQMPFAQGLPPSSNTLSIKKSAEILRILNQYTEGNKRSFSPSALSKYIECSLQFFLRYIADISEPDFPPEPYDARIVGIVLHRVMENFYRPFLKQNLSIDQALIKERLPLLESICDKAFESILPGKIYKDGKPDGRKDVAREVILTNAKVFLKHDMSIVPFKILALEEKVSYTMEIKFPVSGELKQINFSGVIDRVDEINGRIRIVDYKTGSDKLEVKGIESLFDKKEFNKAAFQLFLYSLIYKKMNNTLAYPNLYSIRNINTDGTTFKTKTISDFADFVFTPEGFEQLETSLGQLMEELYNPEVEFKHNSENKHCSTSAYALFCNAVNEESIVEE